MAMTCRNNIKRDSFIMSTIDELVPQDHLVRKLERGMDLSFIYEKVRYLYSPFGRPSIDPVVLFKLLLINIIFGLNSMRKTCEECKVNLAYRWYMGLDINEKIPDYSTWSQNYIRRYKDSEIFNELFEAVLSRAIKKRYVDPETIFGDGTHQKANANKRKSHKKIVEIAKKAYEEELLKEINEDRECIGKNPYESMEKTETIYDEETGEEKKVTKTKEINVSNTDPESGCFHKGEKEKCFAYTHQTFCDKNGFVLGVKTFPGNIHDSVAFFETYEEVNKRFEGLIKNVSLDAGYLSPAICKTIIENGQEAFMPYKAPMTKKGYFKKYEYVYDELYDFYICPKGETLSYTTTKRDGHREYKSDPEKCKDCPLREKCTNSKNHTKVINRHLWEEYREAVEETRHTDKWKEIYPKRKETIERVFADWKEKFGMRFTRVRGLKKNQHQALISFACHNLKRMAIWSCK